MELTEVIDCNGSDGRVRYFAAAAHLDWFACLSMIAPTAQSQFAAVISA